MVAKAAKLLLKDQLFHERNVKHLASLIKNAYPKLNEDKFKKEILEKFPELELKERSYWIRENIEKYLPNDYEKVLNILFKSIENEPEKEDFIFLAFSDYVAKNGCDENNLDKSLNALGVFTKYCSAEFAIRCFINKFPKKTFVKMKEWSKSKNVYQRRLATEGLRPKLPWAKSIDFDYKKGSKILDNLFCDKKRYVTRSVANHMNDISKIDSNFVLEKLEKWRQSNSQNDKEMKYIIQQSLRTSVKKGHINTFNFLGYNSNLKIDIKNLKLKEKNISLGNRLNFSFEIIAEENENLIIDYKIIYSTPNNRYSEKVFKIKTIKIKKDEKIIIIKKHPFRKMTTKRLYSGNHKLEIQINGKILAATEFYLKV